MDTGISIIMDNTERDLAADISIEEQQACFCGNADGLERDKETYHGTNSSDREHPPTGEKESLPPEEAGAACV